MSNLDLNKCDEKKLQWLVLLVQQWCYVYYGLVSILLVSNLLGL